MSREIDIDFKKKSYEDFSTCEIGSGQISKTPNGLSLNIRAEKGSGYNNAQLDDYQPLSRKDFLWQAPCELKIKARFSHQATPSQKNKKAVPLQGTAGFGFWNDPFMMTGFRIPSLPRAVWFFYSSRESRMELAQGVPGHGFKMATMDAWTPSFISMIPLAPLLMPMMWINRLKDKIWPRLQKSIRVQEKVLEIDTTEWHEYHFQWLNESVQFYVDGIHQTTLAFSPRGKLGLVIWIDNQYMVVTPGGKLSHGDVKLTQNQSMEIASLNVRPISSSSEHS